MSRIGKIFKIQSLQIDRAEIAKKAGGECEKINLSSFLFVYRQFGNSKSPGLQKAKLSWQMVKNSPVIQLRSTKQEGLHQLYVNIEKYSNQPQASFFIWQRSNKEKIRKIPYHQVWKFNLANKTREFISLPIDNKYASAFFKQKDSSRHISLLMWVPHQIRENMIHIDPSYYPFCQDWQQKHAVYLEWTRQLKRTISAPKIKNAVILEKLVHELGPDFEKKIELLTNTLRQDIQEKFSESACLLFEMLSASLYESSSMSPEQKLKAISLGIFSE